MREFIRIKINSIKSKVLFAIHFLWDYSWPLIAIAAGLYLACTYYKAATSYVDPSWPALPVKYDASESQKQASLVLPQLGTLGDFVGGILNPVISAITLVWLIKSVRMQRQELNETRAILVQQSFDQYFLPVLQSLASAHKEIAKGTTPEVEDIINRANGASDYPTSMLVFRNDLPRYKDYINSVNNLLELIYKYKCSDAHGGFASNISRDPRSPDERFYANMVKQYVDQSTTLLLIMSAVVDYNKKMDLLRMHELLARYAILDIPQSWDSRWVLAHHYQHEFEKLIGN